MRTIVGVVTYRLLQLILLPFAAVGYAVFVAQSIADSRRSGTSATVLASLYTRYMQHRLGTREDEPAARLMMVMPGVSHPGLFLLTLPTLLTQRLTGYVPGIYRYPYEGEPWHFGIDNTPPAKQRAAEFLERCGLALEEQRNFGPETKWMRAMAGFAIAIVPSAAALWNSQPIVTR